MRMLHSAKAEVDIYDRNREALYDLRDADLRARIHMLVLRIAMPVEGVFDANRRDRSRCRPGCERPDSPMPSARKLEDLLASLRESREGGFEFAMENVGKLRATIRDLEPVARHAFESMEAASRREI